MGEILKIQKVVLDIYNLLTVDWEFIYASNYLNIYRATPISQSGGSRRFPAFGHTYLQLVEHLPISTSLEKSG